MNTILEIESLSKTYGSIEAIKSLSLKLETGKIYGLLGRNGAGKTTLLNLITSRLYAQSGEIRLFGQPGVDNQQALERICCMPEKNLFPPAMRIRDIIRQAASFYPSFDRTYADALCQRFALNPQLKYKALSRGYESILRVVIGLASRSDLTIFDEPVLGLDAAGRDLFYRTLIQDYGEHPRTFIISTHLIDESADIFEDAIILKEGSLVAMDSVENLRKKSTVLSGRKDRLEELVSRYRLVVLSREDIGRLSAMTVAAPLPAGCLDELRAKEIDLAPVSLQKLFIHLTEPPVASLERQVS
ncbi:MAG: ABC transporter ATP-binding protein [Clostridiaceae bacterium]|jgi:ABC-2 type transport system ATP-binding protein|nr:ABC transporter ATP-binding protein [Clostridiaceae bacterium]